jgi:LexA DNA binding domain
MTRIVRLQWRHEKGGHHQAATATDTGGTRLSVEDQSASCKRLGRDDSASSAVSAQSHQAFVVPSQKVNDLRLYAVRFKSGIVKIGISSSAGRRISSLTRLNGRVDSYVVSDAIVVGRKAESDLLNRVARIASSRKNELFRDVRFNEAKVLVKQVSKRWSRDIMPKTFALSQPRVKNTDMPLTMEKLTPVQAQVLRYVKKTIREQQAPPSRTEIASQFGWASANAAQDVLKALARKGHIKLTPGVARGIFVL